MSKTTLVLVVVLATVTVFLAGMVTGRWITVDQVQTPVEQSDEQSDETQPGIELPERIEDEQIEEDDPRWDCEIHGDGECGPDRPMPMPYAGEIEVLDA